MSDRDDTNWTVRHDRMVEDAIRRGISRRDFVRTLTAGGVGLAAGGLLLGHAESVLAATPVRGGTIKAAGWSSSTADTLDPAKASLSTDYVRCCSIYNRLTFLDASGTAQMELAESIDSSDARVWTVKLRSGVTFHSGKSFTSADVVYSLKRHLDPATGSKVNAIASQMESIDAVDPQTVRITLKAPNADLPVILSLHHFMMIADGATDFAKPDGTGAFRVEMFEPGVRSVLVRNENYWKAAGPYLDSYEFFAIRDEPARVNALLSGDIQLAGAVSPRSLRLLESQSGVTVVTNTAGNYTNLNMRLDMAPGNNADFVEGVKTLLNRELIQKSVMRGLAEIANDQPVSPASRYYNAELKPRAFDPEKAKHHFQKAGVLGQSIPMICSDAASSSVDMATVIQQAGAEIGMSFDVQRVPSDGYWSNYWLKAPVHFGNINPRPTPDILFSLLYARDAKWNESQFKSEKFDAMLLEARGLLDDAKRKEIYGEMQAMVSNEAGTAIPVWISGVDAMSTKLKGLTANPLGGLMGYAFAEYVWLES
ncbi:MAG: ABC transporter substrate-binding protein [Ectothiorhodospiraceae bacterium]|nr:ABC transporter substrate-binding protein [Chromatiales bacterium]MCP5154008.1 ABC transporter substrate-binding protein [Ectothiorhodospiraceae bacterium]